MAIPWGKNHVRGRPTVYKDTMPTELIRMMAQGMLDCEIYAEWSISKETFYVWLREKPEFKEAYDIGLPKCEAWWTAYGRQAMIDGNDKGFKHWIAVMNNKHKWAGDRSNAPTNNIQIGNINVLNNKSDQELIEFIQSKMIEVKVIDPHFLEAPQDDGTEEDSD